MSDTKTYSFDVYGGQTKDENGRADWPDMLTMHMDKDSAWNLFYSLMMQLRDNAETVQFCYMGKLEEYSEEEAY